MEDRSPALSNFGGSFAPPDSSVIHFYYTPQEQLRFAASLTESLRVGHAVVLAAPPETLSRFAAAITVPRRKAPLMLTSVLTGGLTNHVRASVATLIQAVREAVTRQGQARLLADFSRLVTDEQVFDVEAELSAAFRGLRLTAITQYDGSAVSALVTVEQFKTHSITVIGDAFYYENRKPTRPEAYIRKRAAAAGAAAAGAAAGR